MQQQEREMLAGHAANAVMGRFKTAPDGFYSENVRQKLILLLQIVDRLALQTEAPLFFSEIVSGYDLVVMRPSGWVPPTDVDAPFDSRVLSAVDDRMLVLLGETFAGVAQPSAGAHVFSSEDGLVYFGFQSVHRAATLAEMGLSLTELVNVTAPLLPEGSVQ